jgi:D-arabinonate dehydratase
VSTSKIVNIETSTLHIPREPVTSAIGTHRGITAVVVKVRNEDGQEGIGWTNVLGSGERSIKAFLDDEFVPIAQGRFAHDVRAIWAEMFRHSLTRGRKGVPLYAMSAMDIALWDLHAIEANLPIHQLLGAVRTSVPVYGDGCWPSLTLEELEGEAQRYTDMELAGIKVKIGVASMKVDLARIDAVREIIGDDREIMIDANQRYDVTSAYRMARHLGERDIFWFEEPLVADSVMNYADLVRRSPVPIASGENEYSRFGFRDLIEAKAVQVLQPDVHRVGGITEFMRICALAEAFEMPVAPHTSFELQGQLVAACSTALMLEYFDWFPDGFFTEKFDVRGGLLEVCTNPGIGARISPESFERYAVG